MNRIIFGVFLWVIVGFVHAMEGDAYPPKKITSFGIGVKVAKHYWSYAKPKWIGQCFWLAGDPFPKIETTPAIEQYLPDLVVAVYNQADANPWTEARIAYENKIALTTYSKVMQKMTGWSLGFGQMSGQHSKQHLNERRARIVDVIGNPLTVFRIPFIAHQPDTTPMMAYYLSQADAVPERTGMAELTKMATNPTLLFSHDIGTSTAYWGHEFPRSMSVTQLNNFRASLVAALHATDLVTNTHYLHVAQGTNNTCGKHCVVSPVTFDAKEKNSFWQEVYPNDRRVSLGVSSSTELVDNKEGHGNYVFVVWRKYRGCIQHEGKYLSSTLRVTPIPKR